MIDTYIIIKNNKVITSALVEKNDINTVNVLKDHWQADLMLLAPVKFEGSFFTLIPEPESHYDDGKFYFKNWEKIDGVWQAPSPMPQDGNVWAWIHDRDQWEQMTPYPSWIWDQETLTATAPVLYPEDGKVYVWNEEIVNWEEVSE